MSRVFAVCAAGALFLGLGAIPRSPQGPARAASVLGSGIGVDHVGIAVRDLEFAAQVYSQSLGFTVVRGAAAPDGISHRIIRFGPTSLELITADPSRAAGHRDASALVHFLATREGAAFLGLHVSSARQTADFLRARRFEVEELSAQSISGPGAPGSQPAIWHTVGFSKPVLPFAWIFFIQYADGLERPAPPAHPNTAIGLHAAWLAVRNLQAATGTCESIGLRAGRTLQVPGLAATGREIAAGQGVLLLLQANDARGSLGSFVSEHGEGFAGVSLEVRDLEIVRTLMENSTEQPFKSYGGAYGESILVAPAFAHGLWIEFFQKPRG